MASSTGTNSKKYTKRSGTSGIRGQLYETKLLSLIYYRAIHDDRIEEFHLATNVDNLGSFDDICLRAKVRELDRPIAVFIQAKHRENSSVLTLNSKSDLVKHFKSYLAIRRKFEPNNKDVLFEGTFSETKCFFVIYTTAEGDKASRPYDGSFAKHLNALIRTGDVGSQPSDGNIDEELLREILLEHHMTTLAQLMAKWICEEITDIPTLMKDELVIRYHVILAQKVFDVADNQNEGYRIVRFRRDFFDVNEKFVQLFKDELCTEISKRRKFEYLVVEHIFNTKRVFAGSDIIYKNGKFEFVDKTITNDMINLRFGVRLDKINESQETIEKTLQLTLKECLPSLEFKVPASFGNKDLTIKGGEKRIERKLTDLTSKIIGLLEKAQTKKIIIDRSLGEGFLQLSGGIASAVGNLLVYDDSSRLMKFNDNYESLGKLAKTLYDKLKSKIGNLNEYKFDVEVEIFPIISFLNDTNTFGKNSSEFLTTVRDFLSSLLFFTSQSNENDVENILIYNINRSQRDDEAHNADMTPNAIFLTYHDMVQKWWMTPKEAPYLTKEGSLYKNAVKQAIGQPLIGNIKMMQRLKDKNYTFNEAAVDSIKLGDQPSGTIIVSENCALTAAKFTQNSNNKNCFILDLEYIYNLSPRDENSLCTELPSASEVETVVIVFDKPQLTTITNIKLENIAQSIKDKVVIIITDQNSVEIAKKYFTKTDNVIKDEWNNLIDLSKESQEKLLKNTTVFFQGCKLTLDQVLDDTLIGCVNGELLHIIMHSNKNNIGKPISNLNYNPKLYIQRAVKRVTVNSNLIDRRNEDYISMYLSTIYDLEEDDVLVIGDPGMGKSTLLAHLSLKTKELYPLVWILRINLLEYSRQLYVWQKNTASVDTLEILKFMCHVAVGKERGKTGDLKITLEESNGVVSLQNCTCDAWIAFEVTVFLHYYNTKNLIMLFDGFDEICPTYAHEVTSLIKVVKNWPRKHKLWVTSRGYDKIISMLELEITSLYRIIPLWDHEQCDYLTALWDENKLLKELNYVQLQNILQFGVFMSSDFIIDIYKTLQKKNDLPDHLSPKKDIPFLAVYLHLVRYLKKRLNYVDVAATVSCSLRFASPRESLRESREFYNDILVAFQAASNRISDYIIQNFVMTPLHLNMMANFLYYKIRVTENNDSAEKVKMLTAFRVVNVTPKEWDLDTNYFNIYSSFVKTALFKVCLEEKNQIDIYKPDSTYISRVFYEDVTIMLQKLAAYTIYDNYVFKEDELKELKYMMCDLKQIFKEVKPAIDGLTHSSMSCMLLQRTGIISNVVDDTPVFVHSTFKEYFAVEYICNAVKCDSRPAIIWHFILNVMFFNCNKNVLALFDAKMKIDRQLADEVAIRSKIIFDLLLGQGKNTKDKHGEIKSALCEAVRHNIRNLGVLLLSTINDNLNDSNLMDFIEIVKKTKMLLAAVKMEFEEVVVTIINALRKVNPSKLSVLFENIENLEMIENIDVVGTDELVQMLHRHVWTRMGIQPEWENLRELSGQIYFI